MSTNNSVSNEEDWLVEVNKPIKTGKGKKRLLKIINYQDIYVMIVRNADSNKESVSLCKTYFAIQTRKQELYSLNQTAKAVLLKILISSIMLDIEVYIMVKRPMILLKEKN